MRAASSSRLRTGVPRGGERLARPSGEHTLDDVAALEETVDEPAQKCRAGRFIQRSFVYAKTSTMSGVACGDRMTRARVGCLWFETDFREDFVHELFRGGLHALARVELGDAHVERLAEHGELLVFECLPNDVRDA